MAAYHAVEKEVPVGCLDQGRRNKGAQAVTLSLNTDGNTSTTPAALAACFQQGGNRLGTIFRNRCQVADVAHLCDRPQSGASRVVAPPHQPTTHGHWISENHGSHNKKLFGHSARVPSTWHLGETGETAYYRSFN